MADEYQQTEVDRRYFIEEALEESEELGDSLTNRVGKTYVGTVLKRFEKRPKTSYLTAIGKKLFGHSYDRDTNEDRIENEKNYRDAVEDAGLYTPKILGEFEEYMEFERIDGDPLPEYLSRADKDEVREIGEYLGNSLHTLHDNDYAITDLRISNILVLDDGSFASIDHEYATDHATNGEKELDHLTLISSSRQLEPDIYQTFRNGFEDGYGKDVDRLADFSSCLSSPVHALLLEHDLHRTWNAMRNASPNLGHRIPNLLHRGEASDEQKPADSTSQD